MFDDFLNGKNACMLVFGQTGSGKTFTIGKKMKLNEEAGVLPRIISDLFQQKKSDQTVYISFVEVRKLTFLCYFVTGN